MAAREDQPPLDCRSGLSCFRMPNPSSNSARLALAELRRIVDPNPSGQVARIVPSGCSKECVLSIRDRKLLDSAADIALGSTSENAVFMHTVLCQVGLPRRAVDGTSFERRSGGAALLIEAGKLWDGEKFVQQPVPYGAKPRLILAYLNTYAVRHRTREIDVGKSASAFLKMLGVQANGGKRGSYTEFKKQMTALAACKMTLGFNAGNTPTTRYAKPINEFQAWASNDGCQNRLWPKKIILSPEYFDALVTDRHAVPMDIRAFHALSGSALAMDIYAMLAERLHRIGSRPVRLNWANLREQFGQEYAADANGKKNFKTKFLKALVSVLAVYPKARISQVRGGIQLFSSPPPIPKLV